jgi:dihydroorotate dehydrogenase
VQVGTGNYLDPSLAGIVADGIVAYCTRYGVPRVSDLVGALEVPAV